MQDYDCSKLYPSPVPRKTCSERIAELETALKELSELIGYMYKNDITHDDIFLTNLDEKMLEVRNIL